MYIRSSISAQSLASVPPSRALIVRRAALAIVRAAQQRLGLQVVQGLFQPLELAGHARRPCLRPRRPFRSSPARSSAARIASSSGLTRPFSPLSSPTTSWAFSRLFQKSVWPICSSMAAICRFLPSKSKRVPELENPLLDIVGPVDMFAFHREAPGGVRKQWIIHVSVGMGKTIVLTRSVTTEYN